MTDLQISLIAAGVTFLVGLIVYNKWHEYKARKTVERAFTSDHDDVLMQPESAAGGRFEPSLGGEHDLSGNVEPGFGPDGDLPAASPASAASADAPAPIDAAGPAGADAEAEAPPADLSVDPLVDCVIPLELGAPVRGEKVLALTQTLRHVGTKPVHFIGHNTQGGWEEIARGGVYDALQAGVQMANRHGALNEIEYSELVTRLRQIADELDAEPDVPDMMTVMRSARELHQFVIECAAQLSVNVAAKGAPWDIATLLAALKRQGFDLRPDGRLVMSDGDTGTLFTLSTNVEQAAETTSLLTLLLDVPLVSPALDGFGAMVACARMLAQRLDGVVVDDGHQPLADEVLTQIADQVKDFYQHMEQSEVPAGSARALRLFA